MPSAIFYSDLTSGPNSGGQNNAGAFVTIHGKGFGSTQGSSFVMVGSGKASSYESWSDSAVTFQLGSAATSGNIVATVGGVASNSVAFTVRAGNIYFVAANGSNSNPGSYGKPWQTVAYATKNIKAGDIIYVENLAAQSTVYTSVNTFSPEVVSMGSGSVTPNSPVANNTALVLSTGGTASAPMALVAYPNSSVSIGSSTRLANGIWITAGNWVLSGLTLRGEQSALFIGNVTGVRIAGSDVSCPKGSGTSGCIVATSGSAVQILGNNIHDNGLPTSTNTESYQAMYLLGTTGVEIGWNKIGNTNGCNAISAYSTSGMQHSISIHDNYIHDTRCGAIELGTVDPSQGGVTIYNNILVNSGKGPAPSGGFEDFGYSAIHVGGGSSSPVEAYNNTIYSSGTIGGPNAGSVRAFGAINLTNNAIYLLSGQEYISSDSSLSWVTGSNNLFFGAGAPLGIFSNSVAGDPMFTSLANSDFHLLAGSPAIDSGSVVQLGADYDGVPRPQGAGYDIGAYESPSLETVAGTLGVSPSSLSFGTVSVGGSSTATAVLSNTGSASVTISQISSSSNLFQTSGVSLPVTLGAGQSSTLTVTFSPTAAGAQSGTISVVSNASNSPGTISVTGTAVAALPVVSMSPTSLAFASQAVGTTSTSQAVTLSNSGTAALSMTSIAASGDFAQTNTCGASLAVNASCSILVMFTPSSSGIRTGAISFTDNAAGSPQQVMLSGTATSATLQAGASSLTFASITAGTSSTQTVVITNSGTASATIQTITTGNAAYTVTGATLPATVAAGGSLTLTVKFAPTAAGSFSGTLAIQSNATDSTLSVALSGAAVAALPVVSLSPTSVTFASQAVGTTSAVQTVTLKNTGTATLSLTSIAASGDFAQSNTCGASLAINASCAISVSFTPTVSGARSGAISFTDNGAASPQQVMLSGTATSATLQAGASSLTFASITAGTSSTQTVVITNSGTASATIQTITTGNAAYTVTGATLPATVAAGGSLTLTVKFAPTSAGSFSGTLAIQSNATDSTLSVALSGTAVAVSHSVTVTWSDAASSISGYNVYRSPQSGTGYVKLNSSFVASTTYTDSSVSGGQTYYYVVTAVNTSGVESSYSAQVTAVVPTP